MLPRIDCNPESCCAQWVLLHRVMLEKGLGITAEAVEAEKFVSYEREMEKAIAAVDRGEAQMACLLKPVRVEQVTDIALGGGVLPQKSTELYRIVNYIAENPERAGLRNLRWVSSI